ncbi:disintegrin and metalloproteinase domain-containing protein 20-like [Prionailurus bengalensis]|uniref:disintegrin and metalloproteinase domain-containing protein 20-like n=1 Tax=Prionailurus bengalensis TaxID=37029 RepID=UPI001CA8E998|nr:disintegrin and metalloproteinase domain-containing protein 20-like [Prionailurus bengalensis]
MAEYGVSIIAVGEVMVHVFLRSWYIRLFLLLFGWSHVEHSYCHGPPEVVIPLRVTNPSNVKKPPGWISYQLHFGGQRHVFHMKVKKLLLSKNFPVFTYTDQGALLEDQPFIQKDCYYRGYVEGDPDSLVSLNTCFGGLQGIMQTNHIVYEILPKKLSTTFEHLVYKMYGEEKQFPPMRCGLTDEKIARQVKSQESNNSVLLQRGYEGLGTHKRFVEMAVVVDYNRYAYRRYNVTTVELEVITTINNVNTFYQPLNIDVSLVGMEVWNGGNPVDIKNMDTLLDLFCAWKKESFNARVPHDIAHVFVKKGYGALGISYVGSICNYNANCAVDAFTSDNLGVFAFVVSHELGHSLGMWHDEKTCKCADDVCIMYATQSQATKFSNCSYARYWHTSAGSRCILHPRTPKRIFRYTRCGNSVVEDGEDCDCGSLSLCTKDPCCQLDCTLSPGATCASGLCCKDCKIMPSGDVCRERENECDLPEWCNGTSYQCPEDVYMQDGAECTGGGYCYEKRCNTRDEQCSQLFGPNAKSASQICYSTVNVRGDRFGNCGLKNHQFIKCNNSDTLCGRVQCKNVAEIPTLRDHSTLHWLHINDSICWGTDFHLGMPLPDLGEIKDGTECGEEHICVQRKCIPLAYLKTDCSPETCNMNGVCNNRHHCHCSYEWGPPDCRIKGTGGSVDSGPPPRRKETNRSQEKQQKKTSPLLFWLIPSLVLFCSLLILSFIRRGKSIKKEDQNVTTAPSKQQNDPQQPNQGEVNDPPAIRNQKAMISRKKPNPK